MKLSRRIMVGGCLSALAAGLPALIAGCGDEAKKDAPAQTNEQITTEHNDKMREYMQNKKAARK
jgi:hypothetical protein